MKVLGALQHNYPPTFEAELKSVQTLIGEPFTFSIPEPYDINNDNVTISVFLADTEEFLVYNQERQVIQLLNGT